MHLWVDVFDASGNRLGAGPIRSLENASVTRLLDGAGSLGFSVPETDRRALTLLTNERRVRVYVHHLGQTRQLASGILRQRSATDNAGGYRLSLRGPDGFEELRRISVKTNRAYDNLPINEIVNDLVSLVPGWSAVCNHTEQTSARFDGASVLKALQALVSQQGLHLRLGESGVLEVGAFGDAVNLTCINPTGMDRERYGNDNIALIGTIDEMQSTMSIANCLFVLGAGQGADAALTLQYSDRDTPYAIQQMTVNNRTLYYLEHEDSIAQFGAIEKFGRFNAIAQLSNTDSDIRRAANALYDAAVAWLERNALPQTRYNLTLHKCTQTVRPGDKIRVVYKGRVELTSGGFDFRDIDDTFWVLKVTESANLSGISVRVEIASIDVHEMDEAKVIIGALEELTVNNITVQPSINHYTYGPEQLEIDPTHPGKVQLIVTDSTFSIDRVLLRVRTQPFTSTAKSAQSTTAEAGGEHRHLVIDEVATGFSTPTAWAAGIMLDDDVPGGSSRVLFFGHSGALPKNELWTFGSSDTHTHHIPPAPLVYGIFRDTVRPANITVKVNGATVTASPIGTTNADLDHYIDITDAIVDRPGGFRAAHDVELTCTSGQGEVLVTFDVHETIAPFGFGINRPVYVPASANFVDLDMDVTVDDDTPSAGGQVTFTISVTNTGNLDATNVEAVLNLPALTGLTLFSSNPSSGSYNTGGGLWSSFDVEAGQTETLELTVTIDPGMAGQTPTLIAFIQSLAQFDINPDNDHANQTLTIEYAPPVAAFSVSAAAGDKPLTVNFTDQSTGDITDWAWDFTNDGSTDSTMQNPSFQYTTSGTFFARLTVTGPGGVSSHTIQIIVNPTVDVLTTIQVDDPDPDPGASITFTITVQNFDTEDAATGVVITDDIHLLPGTIAGHVASIGTYIEATGVWTLGTLPANSSATLTVTVTLD